ncbi:translesion DNA synthesis-associated protein ImuA [Glaciecola sp. MH2013]|uniref:translesion DNA synthesis-associated protein ImuA n=1 Tax=Glaciecola sp. MH2013 TaxID=2785524 RepID=UPI00189E76DC|nr:translesion DNA synthesis-associated protein ImuA [Glaciecola sp. MH2013]MBF7073331.1 translesion DNA synthesis-associated protein ImuA [Glaciecola sp. MH2013]
MKSLLHDLQKKQLVWTASSLDQHKERVATGYHKLDKALHGGFPQAGLVHVSSLTGCGELRLVLPALVNMQKDARLCVFITPPHLLNSEFLLNEGIALERVLIIQADSSDEALWSAEQCAKSGACSAVFIWQATLQQLQAKKLELAAIKGQCLNFFFTSTQQQSDNLPVSLSLSLQRQNEQIQVKINKQKVGWPLPPFKVKLPFKSKLGSPMRQGRQASQSNVIALHAKH